MRPGSRLVFPALAIPAILGGIFAAPAASAAPTSTTANASAAQPAGTSASRGVRPMTSAGSYAGRCVKHHHTQACIYFNVWKGGNLDQWEFDEHASLLDMHKHPRSAKLDIGHINLYVKRGVVYGKCYHKWHLYARSPKHVKGRHLIHKITAQRITPNSQECWKASLSYRIHPKGGHWHHYKIWTHAYNLLLGTV